MGKDELHKLVTHKQNKGKGADRRNEIAQLLARKQTVSISLSGEAEKSPLLLVDVEAIWKGLDSGKKTFDNVAIPAEDEVPFREASEDSQRLRTAKEGRVLRFDCNDDVEFDNKGNLLVDVPVNPDLLDKKGFTALFLAAARPLGGRDEIVGLVQGLANPNAQIVTKVFIDSKTRTVPGGSPLIAAIDSGNRDNIEILLTLGASTKKRVWAEGYDGEMRQFTPLMYSSNRLREKHVEEVRKASAGKRMAQGPEVWEEITEMLANASQTVVDFVKEAPGLASLKNLNREFSLHVICRLAGQVDADDMAEIIVAFPAAVALMTVHRDLPLHLALREGSMTAGAIEQLMQLPDGWEKGFKKVHKKDVVQADSKAFANPMLSEDGDGDDDAAGEDEDAIPEVLKGGNLAKVPDAYGCLPLHLALRSCSAEVVLTVLAAYPEAVNELDGDGDTCLRLALTRCKAVPSDSPEAEIRDDSLDAKRASDIEGDDDGDGILEADEREAMEEAGASSGHFLRWFSLFNVYLSVCGVYVLTWTCCLSVGGLIRCCINCMMCLLCV